MKDIFELVYLIHENEITEKSQLMEKMFVSRKEINELLDKAIECGFVSMHNNYCITKKGVELLKENKIDNAIIMAAGYGSRFVPMTYDTPKGLLKVHGEVMLERQIEQLQAAGISDITIVVGYLKEKFEYLRDKYNVKLIYNKDYSSKNTISSLFYAQSELKNTYILTSDIYMEENIFRKYSLVPFYTAEYHKEHTDEWSVEYNTDGIITHVNPSGGKNVWAINGPVFFTKDFSKKLIKFINFHYDDKSCAQWYWQNVYLHHLSDLDLYVQKYNRGTVKEFECLEELRLYDESYLIHSNSEILDVIKNSFDIELADIYDIKTIKEGKTNDSFIFSVRNQKYVFRNPGNGTDQLINRKEEYDVYKAIDKLGVSDEIIYFDEKNGYKITKYIDNSRQINTENPEEIKLVLKKIKSLHNSQVKVDHEFDIEERINFYYELCKKNNAILFKDFEDVYSNIKKILEILKEIKRPQVLAHIDSAPANFLYKKGNIILLDWEYAGMADPLIDIAMYVPSKGLKKQEVSRLLDMYLERDHTKEELFIIYIYISLAGFLWSLWAQYKQSCGEDFGTYGMDQYKYARDYARLVLEDKKI